MAVISKVTLPDGNTYNIKDSRLYYGTCSTGASTKAKTATLSNSEEFTLTTGATVRIKFTYSNTNSAPTLEVNSTGAKNIKKYGTTATGTTSTTSWYAGSVVTFTYDGTNWIQNDYKEDTEANDSVSQTNTTANANYRVLLSHSANNDTETAGVYKNQGLYFNTSSGILYPYRTVVTDYLNTPKLNGFECGPSLAEFKAALGIKDLLWENASPSSAFASQTVSLALSNYGEVQIDYITYTGQYASCVKNCCLSIPHSLTYLNEGLEKFYIRAITVTSTGVNFGNGQTNTTYNKWSTGWTTDNLSIVPIRIWGWNPPHLAG